MGGKGKEERRKEKGERRKEKGMRPARAKGERRKECALQGQKNSARGNTLGKGGHRFRHRRRFIHPLPLRGLHPVSGGERRMRGERLRVKMPRWG